MATIKRHPYWILLAGVVLLLIGWIGGPRLAQADPTPTAEQTVQRAWRRAQEATAYSYTTAIVQTTYPAPALTNVGRGSQQEALYLEGTVRPLEREMWMTLWKNGGSVLDPRDGVEVHIAGDRAEGRQIGGMWQEIPDFSNAFAPGQDLMAYLAGATHVRYAGAETRTAGDLDLHYERYTFLVDGSAFAAYLRDRLEAHLQEKGELPLGLVLDSSSFYRSVTGEGEVWVDTQGLPLRLAVQLDYPREDSGERIAVEVQTDFSAFELPQAARGSARDGGPLALRQRLANLSRTLGTLQARQGGLWLTSIAALGGLLRLCRRSKAAYAALSVGMVLSLVLIPLLNSEQVYAFFERQEAEQDELERERQDRRTADELAEMWTTPDWDPHRDPLAEATRESPLQKVSEALLPGAQEDTSPSVSLLAPSACDDQSDPDKDEDPDEDGLTNCQEMDWGTEPDQADSDGDGLLDGWEVLRLGTDPQANGGDDSDGDGIRDDMEVVGFAYANRTWYSNPSDADTDGDRIIDSVECPQRKASSPAPAASTACRDTDSDGVPDLFDTDSDGDGVPDRIDLSPFTVMGTGNPFTRDDPFELRVTDLAHKHGQPNAYFPVLVDFQLRPAEQAHLTYALNVLDWPSGDEGGQIQRRTGNDSTFADGMTAAERAANPSAENGDMRLIPMLEIEMNGSHIPLPLTTPQATVQVQGERFRASDNTYGRWISATVDMRQVGDNVRVDVDWDGVSSLDRLALYEGTCARGGDLVRAYENVADSAQKTLSNRDLTALADGEHFWMLTEGDDSVCATIGDIPNGPYSDKMIDLEPLQPYGVSVRDKGGSAVLAYVPLNVVADESGGGRVAFAAHMLYQPQQANLGGSAQKVQLVWLIQMLTDYCRPEPPEWRALHANDEEEWCDQSYAWQVDQTQIVHTYDDPWTLTGLAVREDRGLDVAVMWEDPATKPADERSFDGWLWTAARGLEESFVSGRDQDEDQIRDLGIVTHKNSRQVANETLASRFDAEQMAPGTTIVERLGVPLTVTMRVDDFAYPDQDHLAQIMMAETPRILEEHFDPALDTPTLLFAREERYRYASMDMGAYREIDGSKLTVRLGTNSAQRPEETLATLSWAPYRYQDGSWQSFAIEEYWDRMQVQLGEIFAADPTLGEDGEDIALGEITVARSFYLSMYQGRVDVVQVGSQLTYEFDARQTDNSLAEDVAGWIKKGGGQINGITQTIIKNAIQSYDVLKMVDEVMANVFKGSYTQLTKSQLFAKALGQGIKGAIKDKLKLDTLKKLFGKLSDSAGKKGAAALGVAVAVAAVAVVTLTIVGFFLENKVAVYVVQIAATTISAVLAVASAIKTVYQFVKGTLEPLSKAAMVAGVVGVIIAGVVAFAAFLANVLIAHVRFASIAFNSMLAGVIASTITAAIMFAITMIPIVGQIIAAIIAVIDALIFAICAAVPAEKLSEGKVGQWFCKGISGLVSEAIKWAIYGATVMVDLEDENRLQFAAIDYEFVDLNQGMIAGSEIQYSAELTNTINLVNVPIDWKAAAYAWQYTIDGDDHLQSSNFVYEWQTDDIDLHDDLDRGEMDPAWESETGSRPYYVAITANSSGIVLQEAGINRKPALYLSEGYAVPAQECIVIPSPLFIPPPIPFVNLFPECHIRTERATNHMDLGDSFVFDVFPATLDGFYETAPSGDGYTLAWAQDGDTTFGVQRDLDGDGLLSPQFGGSDPDDRQWDLDGDGLSDAYEFERGSDPTRFDTDADGLPDGEEARLQTDPTRQDTDGDGLTDRQELDGWEIVYAFDSRGLQLRTRVSSDPRSVDADADSLTDFREKVFGFNPHVESDPHVMGLQSEVYESAAPQMLLRFEEDVGAETFADRSGYGNLAACAALGCPVSVEGRYGYGLQFNGAQWLDGANFDIGDDFTIALWVNPQTTDDGQAFIGKHASNGYNYLLFGFYQGGYSMRIRGAAYTAGAKTTGWQHLAVVGSRLDGSTTRVKVYRDGTLLWQSDLGAVVGNVLGKGWAVGQDWDDATRTSDFFHGRMDEVIVVDRALSRDEVRDLRDGLYNPGDLFVQPGDELAYRATVTNKLFDRYGQGLLSLETSAPAAFSAFDVPPQPFELMPLEQREVASGTMQIASTAASGVVTLTQVAAAEVTDRREQSDFAELWLPLNDSAGAETFADASGSMPARDGTCSEADGNCPARQQSGYFDYAVRFDGANDRIRLPDTEILGLKESSFSVSAWIKGDSFSGGRAIMGTDQTGVNNEGLYLGVHNAKPHMGFWNNTLDGNLTMYADRWYHVVFRYDVDLRQQSIWVNGEQRGVRTGAAPFDGTGRVFLGRAQSQYYFDGLMDDVRVFKRALTPQEIRALYTKPVLQFQFEESTRAATTYSPFYFADTSGFNNLGLCMGLNCPGIASGLQGNAADFGGTNHIAVGPYAMLGLDEGQFTFSAWVYPRDQDSGQVQGILGHYTGYWNTGSDRTNQADKTSYPTLLRVGRKLRFGFGDGSKWHSRTSSGDVLANNRWNHVVLSFGATYDSSGNFVANVARLYVNGALTDDWGFGSAAPYSGRQDFYVGRAGSRGTVYLDDFKVEEEADSAGDAEIYIKWEGDEICTSDTENVGDPAYCRWGGLDSDDWRDIHQTVYWDVSAKLEAWEDDSIGKHRDHGNDDELLTQTFHMNDLTDDSMTLYGDGGWGEKDTRIDLYLGSGSYAAFYNPSIPFRGRLDEVTLYKRPLSADEVLELYLSASTALHLPLDDPPGSESLENAVDLSQQGNAYCSGTACPTTGVSGRLNQAALLDGVDDVLHTAIAIDQTSESPGATLVAWVYPTSTSSGLHQVISTDDGGWDWSLARMGNTWWFFDGLDGIDTGIRVEPNRWQHVAVVLDPARGARFFKDGAARVTSPDLGYTSSAGAVTVGRRAGGEEHYFDGRIDDVRVFNRPLSDDDVYALYRAAPVFQLHLDEAQPTSLLVDSAQGRDASCVPAALCAPITFQNLYCHAQDDGLLGGAGEFYVNLDGERVWRGEDIVARGPPYPIGVAATVCNEGEIEVFEDDTVGDDDLGSYTVYSDDPGPDSHRFTAGGDDVTLTWSIGSAEVSASTCPTVGVPGQVGLALAFGGGDDHLSVPADSGLDMHEFTVGAWVMPVAVHDKWQPLVVRSNAQGGERNYGLWIEPGEMTVRLSFEEGCGSGQYRSVSSATALIMNQWNHVMGTYDGTEMHLYVNGYRQGSASVSGTPCTANRPLWIGGGISASNIAAFEGSLDEVTLYDHALSPTEVRDVFLYQGKLVEERQSHAIAIDDEDPISTLRSYTPTLPYMPDEGRLLHVEARDASSGVSLVELGVNGDYAATTVPRCAGATDDSAWCPYFEPAGEGRYALTTRATDLVGHRETPAGESVLYVDGTPPAIGTDLDEGDVLSALPHSSLANAWSVPLAGTVSDPQIAGGYTGSGVDPQSVRVTLLAPGGADLGADTQPAAVEGNEWFADYVLREAQPTGAYTLRVQARDRVGNERTVDLVTFQVDATAPGTELGAGEVLTAVVTSTVALSGTAGELPLLPGALLRLHMEESAGATRFEDSSGYGHHGACSGATCPAASFASPYGRGLSFDRAVGEWIDVPGIGLADFGLAAPGESAGDWSMSLWVNPTTTDDGQAWIGKHSASGDDLLLFGFYDGGYAFTLRGQRYSAGTKTSGWQHLAVTGQAADGGKTEVRAYRDGLLLWQHTFDAVAGDLAGKAWTLGQDWDGALRGDFYGGLMDEVALYRRALSAEEVRLLAQPASAGVQGVQYAFRSTAGGAVSYNEQPPADQALHLAFEDGPDENGLLSFRDLSGHGRNATCSGESCPAVGAPGHAAGSAVLFDSVDDYAFVPDGRPLAMDDQLTLALWVHPAETGAGGGRGVLVAKVNQYILARNENGTIAWAFHNADPGWRWVNTGYVAPAGRWTHLAVVYNAGTITTLANGEVVHTYNGSGSLDPTTNRGFRIGGNGAGAGNYAGRIDDLRIVRRALSADEVQALYLGAGPVLVLPLDEAWAADGNRAADASGWEQHGAVEAPGRPGSLAVAGIVGAHALQLGVGQRVAVPDSPALDLEQFSAGGWFRISPSFAGAGTLLAKAGAARGGTNYALARTSANTVEMQLGAAGCAGAEPARYPVTVANDGAWQHLLMTYDGVDLRLYVNGALAGVHAGVTQPTCANDGPLTVGGAVSMAVDEVRVYGRALSADEARALYGAAWRDAALAGGGAGTTLTTWSGQVPEGLEGFYRLDLRGEDVGDHAAVNERVWSGAVDTLAPRIALSSETVGARTRYTAVAEDFNLSESGFSSPCGAGAIDERGYYQSPWWLALSGQTADRAQKLVRLSTSCEFDIYAVLPGEIGAYDTPGSGLDVVVADAPWAGAGRRYAYVADGFGGLQVIDVSDPVRPALVVEIDTPGWAQGVAVSGTHAYVAQTSLGLGIYDLRAPEAVSYTLATSGLATDLVVDGRLVYLAAGRAGLRVIDVGDPGAPVEVSALDTPGYARDIAFSTLPAQVAQGAPSGEPLATYGPWRPQLAPAAQGTYPDLVIEGIGVSTTTLEVREPLTVSVTLRNAGPGDSSSVDVGLYVDRVPEGGCQFLGWRMDLAPPLTAGETRVLTFTYPGFDAPGVHTLYAEADPYCMETEEDEDNNVGGPALVTATAFHVLASEPLTHALNVARDSIISATLSRPVEGSTVTTRTFRVHGAQSGTYAGTYTLDPLQFDPARDFQPGERIDVTLNDGLQAVDGSTLIPYAWTFWAAVVGGTGVLTDSGQRLGAEVSGPGALGDLDGDGDLDLVRSGDPNGAVWINQGGAQGGEAGVLAGTGQDMGALWFANLALGDLDGDGDLDLFAAHGSMYASEPNSVWLNDGSGAFADSGQALGSAQTTAAALGDLDGDGDLDAYVANYEQMDSVWFNDGGGVFTDTGQFLGSDSTVRVALGDLDGDGDLDALLGNANEASQTWLNLGGRQGGTPGTFYADMQSLSSNVRDLALGDVDGDRDLDAVLLVGANAELWLNDGGGTFVDSGQSLGGVNSTSLALGDVDGDGDLDLLVGDGGEIEQPNLLWLNDGSGAFSDSGQRLGSEGTAAVALADVDGDGDLDAWVGNTLNDGAPDTVWINNAHAPLAVNDTFAVPENSADNLLDVLANDSDADGDALELLRAGAISSAVVTHDGSVVFYSPPPAFSGTDVLSYTVSDPGGLIAVGTVTVTVGGVNQPPVAVDDSVVTSEDTPIDIPVLDNDSDPNGQVLSLLALGTASLGAAAIAGRQVAYVPAADVWGLDVFTYTASDGSLTATATISVTISPLNDPPTLDAPADVTLVEGSGTYEVALSGIGSGAANEVQTLTVTAVSIDTLLIPHPEVLYVSPQPTGTLRITPLPNAFGVAAVQVTVSDGLSETVRTFVVTVNQVNDPPTLDPLADLSFDEDSGTHDVPLSGIGAGAGENQTLVVSATSSAPAVIPHPGVVYASPSPTGTLRITPAPDAYGTATVQVTVTDGLSETGRAFVVTVSPVEDAPTIDVIADRVVYLDASTQEIALGGIGSGAANEVQALAVSAESSNVPLIPHPEVIYASPNPTGTLRFASAAGQTGEAILTVRVSDGISETTRSFRVAVVPLTGPFAYVADADGGLRVIDLSRPETPTEIATVEGYAVAVAVADGRAYVVGGDRLRVYDVTDPRSPTLVGELEGYFNAVSVAQEAGQRHLYLTDQIDGLQIVDVSDPRHPQVVRALQTPGSAQGVAAGGGETPLAYVADGGQGLRILNPNGVAPGATACDTAGNCSTMAEAATPMEAMLQVGPSQDRAGDAATRVTMRALPAVIDRSDPIPITGHAYAVTSSLQALTVTVDGARLYTETWAAGAVTTTDWATTWAPAGEGVHVLHAALHDADGGTAAATLTVTLDTQPPALTISPTVLTGTHLYAARTVDLTGAFSDTSGVERVEVWIEAGGRLLTTTHRAFVDAGTRTWRFPWYLDASNGRTPDGDAYTVTVEGVDAVGHTARIAEAVVVDVVPPAPVEIAVRSAGQVVTPGATLRDPAPTLAMTWTASSDGSGLSGYGVRWTTVLTGAHLYTETVAPAGPRSAQIATVEGTKVSAQIGSRDAYGQERWTSWGPAYVDGPRTPDYALLDDPDGVYRGWMESGCARVGVDRRVARAAADGEALEGEQSLYVTWNVEALRLTWAGADWETDGDLLVYLDTGPGGAITAGVPYSGAVAGATIYLPGVTPTTTVAAPGTAMAADYLVWVRDRETATLWRWDAPSQAWSLEAPLGPVQFRYDGGAYGGVADLYLPLAQIGLGGGGGLDLVAVASEDLPGSVAQGLRLWAAMPPANPLNGARVIDTAPYAQGAQTFALTQRYHWDALGTGVCANGADGSLPVRYADADLRVRLEADPPGAIYSLAGDDLFWLWDELLDGRPADVLSSLDFLAQSYAPLGHGQAITYTVRYQNRGSETAVGVRLEATAHHALRLLGGATDDALTLSLGDVAPGQALSTTVRGVIDTGRSALDWASLEVRVYDGMHGAAAQPLDHIWVDHSMDRSAPVFFGLRPAEDLLRAGENLLQGYAYDPSGVPEVTFEIEGHAPLACPDDTPQDGAWSCTWDTSGAADGETYRVRMRAVDALGQAAAWDGWQTFVVDARPPTVTVDLTTTQALSGAPLRSTALTLRGAIDDNRGLGSVEVCAGGVCEADGVFEAANVWLDGGRPGVAAEEVFTTPLPVGSTTACVVPGQAIVHTLVVSEAFDVALVKLGLGIAHAHRDDLRVTLRSPAGTEVQVLGDDGVSGTGWPDYDLLLDDAAVGAYSAGSGDDPGAPLFEREARPYAPLRAFQGEGSAGVWTVTVCDAHPEADDGAYAGSRLELTPLLSQAAARAGRWSYQVTGLEALDYVERSVEVYGTDLVGNRTAEPLRVSFTVDNVPPALAVTAITSTVPLTTAVRVLEGTMSDGSAAHVPEGNEVAVYVRTPAGRVYAGRAPWDGLRWSYDLAPVTEGEYTLWVIARDAAGNHASAGPYALQVVAPLPTEIRMPLVACGFLPGPDLVTQFVVATENEIAVAIANLGTEPVVDEFWVDVYVNPSTVPSAVNQTWPQVGKEGLAWGVTADALPLLPGQVLTLTLDGPYYVPFYSHVAWPVAAGSQLYAQVDSANAATDYGAVREAHEAYGGMYNNLASIVVRPAEAGSEPPLAPRRTTLPAGLPERP